MDSQSFGYPRKRILGMYAQPSPPYGGRFYRDGTIQIEADRQEGWREDWAADKPPLGRILRAAAGETSTEFPPDRPISRSIAERLHHVGKDF